MNFTCTEEALEYARVIDRHERDHVDLHYQAIKMQYKGLLQTLTPEGIVFRVDKLMPILCQAKLMRICVEEWDRLQERRAV